MPPEPCNSTPTPQTIEIKDLRKVNDGIDVNYLYRGAVYRVRFSLCEEPNHKPDRKTGSESKSPFLEKGKLARARRGERKAEDEQNQKSY